MVRAAADPPYGHSHVAEGERVMVEYVSPNTNKPLHLGHVRNAVLGRAVARLAASQGAQVHKTDIINDRGIHIAKSMIAYRKYGEGRTPASTGVKGDHFVGQYYVRFDQALREERKQWEAARGVDRSSLDELRKKELEDAFQNESILMSETRLLLQAWEAEDPEVRELWRTMNSWVYAGFAETYELLGIDFDKHYYESDIYRGGRDIILDALERGVFEKAPNGAVVAPLSKHGKLQDKVVLRGDGTGLYITQDINLATIKFEEFGLTRSLYVIGSEQDFYMKQLKATLEQLGVPWAQEVHHLSYGMVYLPEGKMKSREGTVVDADDLVGDLQAMARQALEDRLETHDSVSPQVEDGAVPSAAAPDPAELDRRARAIALAAITFNFLLVGRETDIQFDPHSSLAFEGKTGPYLQYTGARIASILRKAGHSSQPDSISLTSDAEFQIVKQLALFPLAVADAAESYDPSRLAVALFELGQSFNAFYHDHRVLDAEEPERSSRLALLEATLAALRNGLNLLGIETLDEM
jgi:arginyl-tRNA synthetase